MFDKLFIEQSSRNETKKKLHEFRDKKNGMEMSGGMSERGGVV